MKLFPSRRSLASAALALAAAATATEPLDARPHDGLGEYWMMLYGRADLDDHAFWNNTSMLPFGAMGNLPALTSAGEVATLLRQLDQPYYTAAPSNAAAAPSATASAPAAASTATSTATPSGSRDGRHPATFGAWETYASTHWSRADIKPGEPNLPIFDSQTWGALAGIQRWFDNEHLFGVNASYNFARADLHDGGGRIQGDNFRARIYTALAPEGQPWWLVIGASAGYVDYKTRRNNTDIFANPTSAGAPDPDLAAERAAQRATASPQGYEIGAFGALNARFRLNNEITLKPLLRLDYTTVDIAKFSESGAEFAYRVNRFTSESLQSRIGAALEHKSDYGPFFLTAACAIAWADEWSGNDTRITGEFRDPLYSGSQHTIRAGQLFDDAMEITPSLSFTFRNGLIVEAAWQLQISFDGQFSQSLSGGVFWRF